ncbi:MAG: HEAT repeat domain-containing protein, partial [Chloroflexota bacterium]|nr:HEAT repeat domain-containing protein [Chloroflexota bacterium]
SFDALMSQLSDPEISNVVGRALQELHDQRSIDRLLPTLATDDANWRGHVAAIVGKVGAPAVEPLLELLTSEDSRLRAAGATGLGFTQDRRAVDPLAESLRSNPESEVRAEAASSLGFLPDEGVVEPIVGALSDSSVRVRQAALGALYHLALTRRAPLDILPAVEWVAANDAGTIQGYPVIKDTAQRVVRELRLQMDEEEPASRLQANEPER